MFIQVARGANWPHSRVGDSQPGARHGIAADSAAGLRTDRPVITHTGTPIRHPGGL